MNNKQNPEACDAKLCCKATAELQIQVENELQASDKCLANLLETQDSDSEDKNPKE